MLPCVGARVVDVDVRAILGGPVEVLFFVDVVAFQFVYERYLSYAFSTLQQLWGVEWAIIILCSYFRGWAFCVVLTLFVECRG